MTLMLIILIPYLVLAAGTFFSLRALLRSHAPSRILFLPSLLISIVLTGGLIAWGFIAIDASTSSTAAIGYLVLPYMALAAAVFFFLLVLAAGVVIRYIAEQTGRAAIRLTSAPKLIGAILFLAISGWLLQQNMARSRLLDAAAAEATAPADLQSMLTNGLETHDIELQSRLARNPALPVSDLTRLFDSAKEQLKDPLSDRYALYSSLARNPRTPTGILTELAASPFSSVRIEVILNPSTPLETLVGMADDEDELVYSTLSDSPRLPEEFRHQIQARETESPPAP